MKEVFVTHPRDRLDGYFGDQALRALREIAEVRLNPHDRELTTSELAAFAQASAAIISYRASPGSAELFDALPRLQAFVRCAMDIRNVDVAAASRHGILVTRAGAGFVSAVAEWVIAVMIDLARHISAYVAAQRSGEPAVPRLGRELRGATLGVLGYGRVGAEVCRLAAAFGMRILASDPHRTIGDAGVVQVELPTLLGEADFVVCLAAATAHTENLMDAQAFAAMKPEAHFINAARGNLVDETALLHALEAGRLAGCAIDVGRAADQMPSARLAAHPRVIATPHIGGLTRTATEHQALQTVRQVAALFGGRLPEGAVNADSASRCGFQRAD